MNPAERPSEPDAVDGALSGGSRADAVTSEPARDAAPATRPDASAGATEAAPAAQAPRTRRPHRRVRTEPVPGSDPNPAPEPRRHASSENDARLRADKPPHWG